MNNDKKLQLCLFASSFDVVVIAKNLKDISFQVPPDQNKILELVAQMKETADKLKFISSGAVSMSDTDIYRVADALLVKSLQEGILFRNPELSDLAMTRTVQNPEDIDLILDDFGPLASQVSI